MKNHELSSKLGVTISDSNLTNLTVDIIEAILDETLLEEGILKEIPIISSILGINKSINSIQDYLFTKKILSFLTGLSNISPQKRNEAISKIDKDENYNQSVGSKLLYIIDNAQDHEIAKLISKLFVAFISEKLSYQEFCKSAQIINRIDYYDLLEFLKIKDDAYGQNGTEGLGLEEIDNFLITAGLCSAETSEVNVEDEDDWKMDRKYKVEGGVTKIYRTLIGNKIYNILANSNCP